MSENQNEKPARIKLTSLWRNTTQDGTEYLSGYWGDARIQIWPNGYKTEDNHPDVIVYLVEKKKRDDNQQRNAEREFERKRKENYDNDFHQQSSSVDDVPF